MMLMSDGKEFSENLGQAYKAMTYHLLTSVSFELAEQSVLGENCASNYPVW